ncbi:hypothetical protein ABPG75_002722 [Micractinium tetrahymenae]
MMGGEGPCRARPLPAAGGGGTPPAGTPRAAQAVPSNAATPPATPTQQRALKQGMEGSRRAMPVTLLFGAAVLLLMVAGMAASDQTLRISKMGALSLPAPLLSTSSFSGTDQQGADGAQPIDNAFEEVFTSAAATLGEQLVADGFSVRQQPPPSPPRATSGKAGHAAAAVLPVPPQPPPSPPAPPAKWGLRCAVVNNLVFHIDVMAGWTYAFQSAGCDVTVYQNERSLGIEAIMSSWLKGRFRKPELFPGEAGDYHIVILPTFRDQHAELIQYLLQLPRLKRQRYFLTQHNPDWLLNRPNVDIVQQHLLAPLLASAQAVWGGAAPAAATLAAPLPLLRVQLVTLAPCVSNYTLHFLRQMAFNITEGHTYAERVGSFRVRSKTGGGAGEDNSEVLQQWIDSAINVEVPWLSPLVPWEPGLPLEAAPAAAASMHRLLQQQDGSSSRRRYLQELEEQEDDSTSSSSSSSDNNNSDDRARSHGRERAAGKQGQLPQLPPGRLCPPSPSVNKWWLTGAAPPPPPPLGAEALALLAELNMHRTDDGARHVCIQGKLENSRRDYKAAFEALSHPAVLRHLRGTGERMLLLGHRSKWETVVVPEEVQDVVVVLESLPYTVFFDTLSRCRAILLAFATDEYYAKKSSSTIATALNVGVPLVAERRTLEAYNFLQPKACFVYDDRMPGTLPPSKGAGRQGGPFQGARKDGAKGGQAAESKKGQRRLLLEKEGGGSRGDEDAKSPGPPKPQQQEHPQQGEEPHVDEPQTGSYSAAILAALRSESSAAARVAVAALKEQVMRHNRAVAAAFMAESEAQYAAEERAMDAGWWRAREAERAAAAAAAVGGSWPSEQPLSVQER